MSKVTVTEVADEYVVEVFGKAREYYDDDYYDTLHDAEDAATRVVRELRDEDNIEATLIVEGIRVKV